MPMIIGIFPVFMCAICLEYVANEYEVYICTLSSSSLPGAPRGGHQSENLQVGTEMGWMILWRTKMKDAYAGMHSFS